MNNFSAGDCIRFGWETFKKRPWFFVGVTLLVGILTAVGSGIGNAFGDQGVGAGLGNLINFAISTLIGLGTTTFYLRAHDAPDSVESSALWNPGPFWRYLGATLLFGLFFIVGLILLVVPGIIVALMLMFTCYIVVDRNMGPIEALKESKRITKGHLGQLFGFFLLFLLINILGAVALVVGLLVSVPVTMLAMVHAYRTLAQSGTSVSA